MFWPEERCYSEMLESKLVEPKEATIGVIAKVKQGGKLYSETTVAVGTKSEIEQQLKELVMQIQQQHKTKVHVHVHTCK